MLCTGRTSLTAMLSAYTNVHCWLFYSGKVKLKGEKDRKWEL